MAEVHEAVKSQLALIASLSTHIHESSPVPGVPASVKPNASVATAPIVDIMQIMQRNLDETEKTGAANVAEGAKDRGPGSRSEGPELEGPGGEKVGVDMNGAENDDNKSPCASTYGYTFPMLFGSPKEQRTPDARPAEHESHHTIGCQPASSVATTNFPGILKPPRRD